MIEILCRNCGKLFSVKPSRNACKFCSMKCKGESQIGVKQLKISGKNHYLWKGDKVGYFSLHRWVRKELGNPMKCSKCGTTTAQKYEWANISGEYKRSNGLEDWERLCRKCHCEFDYSLFSRGESLPQAKLTNHQVLKIRKEHAENKITLDELAKKYKISRHPLWCVVNRKTWKHI